MSENKRENRREKVFQEILDYKRTNDGCSPSIRDLATLTGIPSHSSVYLLLKELEGEGRIIMSHDKYSRGIQVVGGLWVLEFG